MTTALRVLLRRMTVDRWVVALLVALVLGTTALTAAVWRTLDAVATAALRQTLAEAGPSTRNLTATVVLPPPVGPAGAPEAPYRDLATQVDRGPGADLAGMVDPAQWSVTSALLRVERAPRPGGVIRKLSVRVADGWAERVRLVAGRAPTSGTSARPPADRRPPGLPAAEPTRLEVAVSRTAAELMRLQVGDRLVAVADDGADYPAAELTVVGLFEAADPGDPFWELDPSALRPRPVTPPNGPPERLGIAFAGVGALPALADQLAADSATVAVRLPLRASEVSRADPVSTVAALRRATARTLQLTGADGDPFRLAMTTTAPRVLIGHLAARTPVLALAWLLSATLLVAAVVTMLLAARLLVRRRTGTLSLALARGAGPGQLCLFLGLESVVLGPPAAVAGYVLTAGLPGELGLGAWWLPALGLLPVVILPWTGWNLLREVGATGPARRRPGDERAGSRGAGPLGDTDGRAARARWAPLAAAGLLVALAVAALLQLRSRGLAAGSGPAGGVDPVTGSGGSASLLVLLTPALLAAALAAPLAMAAPPVLGAVAQWVGRSRSAVAFLALARSARYGGLGPWGMAAVLLALTSAVLGAVTSATVDAGTATNAAHRVAADLRLTGPGFDDRQVAALRELPGVRAVSPVLVLEGVSLSSATDPAGSGRVDLIGADPGDLAAVQRGLPGTGTAAPAAAAAIADTPAADGPGSLAAVVAPGVAQVGDRIAVLPRGRRVQATVVAVRPAFPGAPQDRPWVLLPLDEVRAQTGLSLTAPTLLVDVGPPGATDDVRIDGDRVSWPGGATGATDATGAGDGSERAAITRGRLEAVLGEQSVTSMLTVQEQRERVGRSPLVAAITRGVPLAVAICAGYAGLAIMLTVLVGSTERGRFLAQLRAVGLSARQSGSLVALEVMPVVLVVLLVGVLLGVLAALLVLPVTDLRSLCEATLAVPVRVAAGPLAAVVAGFAAILVMAVTAAALSAGRISPAAAARAGDP